MAVCAFPKPTRLFLGFALVLLSSPPPFSFRPVTPDLCSLLQPRGCEKRGDGSCHRFARTYTAPGICSLFGTDKLTGFLASVASADEARIACEQGADFIDAKDPTVGALGALSPVSVRQIVEEVGGRTSVSAVAGDL